MATRRSHNKTRLGCQQCKRRRIKCDCRHPSCANCDKRGDSCSFLLLVPSSRLTTGPQSRVATLSKSPIPETPSQTIITVGDSSTKLPGSVQHDIPPPPSRDQSPRTSSTHQLDTFPELDLFPISIPRFLRCNDVWKDIRDPLPPALQDVLYHYEYTTSLTLATNDPAKAAWQNSVPQLAHHHSYLVNCVLSVASLHLARLHSTPTEKATMTAIAASRMNKALTLYRAALSNVTPENAAALFATSTLTAVYLFRTASLDMERLRASLIPKTPTTTTAETTSPTLAPPDTTAKMLACVLRTIWALRGPLTVLLAGWDWVTSGAMSTVAARKWWPQCSAPATERAHREDAHLASLASLWASRHFTDTVHLDAALAHLRESYALISQLTISHRYPPMTAVPYSIDDATLGTLTDRGAIFVWSTRISREFIALLEAGDRDALVLLAHFAVLPGRVRNVWWLEGLGKDIVTAVAMAVGERDWGLIEWAARVVGVELGNAFMGREEGEGKLHELRMEVI